MAITSANQLELLQTAEAVAREKMIDPDLVIQAMEDSLARAAKSRYGAEMDIRVKIDRKTGRASFTRVRTVTEDDLIENHHAQITVKQASRPWQCSSPSALTGGQSGIAMRAPLVETFSRLHLAAPPIRSTLAGRLSRSRDCPRRPVSGTGLVCVSSTMPCYPLVMAWLSPARDERNAARDIGGVT